MNIIFRSILAIFKSYLLKRCIFCFFIIFIFIHSAFAADPIAQIPSLFDPGLFSKTQRSLEPTRQQPIVGAIKKEEQPSTFPEGNKIRFMLNHVTFKGNTVFSDQELQEIFKSSLHKIISLNDLQNLVSEVTKKYRSTGYILSRSILPPQEIKGGSVKVQVIEGYVSKVTIEGETGTAHGFLQGYANYILASRPLKLSLLEHEMLLANDLPGLTVRAVLKPSEKVPGTADLTLVSTRKVFDGYVAYDNYGTRFLGPQEFSFGTALNAALFPGDKNAVNFAVTSHTKELQFAEFVHSQPLGCQGLNWLLGTNYTQTKPQFTLQPLEIIGRSFLVYSNLTYPLIRSRSKNLILRAAANYLNVTSTILSQPYYQDRFRTLSVGAAFDTDDKWHGYDTIGFDVEQGFDIWGANKHFFQSRPKGNPEYTKFELSASRLHQISSRFSFLMSLQSQYAFIPLLASEQFSYGGAIYGRGYGPSEIVGDRGLAGKAELRMDTFPEWKFLNNVQYYIFYDGGEVWNLDGVNLIPKQSATSTGVGARFNFIPQLSGELFIAKPLTHKAFTLTPTDQNAKQARGFFQIVARL